MQLADWDGDGDVDVLVGESRIIKKWNNSLHAYEAIATRIRKLVELSKLGSFLGRQYGTAPL